MALECCLRSRLIGLSVISVKTELNWSKENVNVIVIHVRSEAGFFLLTVSIIR